MFWTFSGGGATIRGIRGGASTYVKKFGNFGKCVEMPKPKESQIM